MMAAETWMTADEAIALGFADASNGQAKMAAHVEPGRFHNVPAVLLSAAPVPRAVGPDEIKAAIAVIDDERVLRGLASNIGNRIQQLGNGAPAGKAADSAAPTPEAKTVPPDVPPAPKAADARTEQTPTDEPKGADPLVLEATLERIRKVREAAKTANA